MSHSTLGIPMALQHRGLLLSVYTFSFIIQLLCLPIHTTVPTPGSEYTCTPVQLTPFRESPRIRVGIPMPHPVCRHRSYTLVLSRGSTV
eukprot:2680000-Rhodomonas_salina.2